MNVQWGARSLLDLRIAGDFSFDQDAARPWLLTIWEPLQTKAPGPHLSRAYCCYMKTVIFYYRPYVVSLHRHIWFDDRGRARIEKSAGRFEQWDQIETALTWDDQIRHGGDLFIVGGGRVLFTNAPDHGRRRWWMKRWARRESPR